MLTIAVLSVVAASLLLTNVSRYQTTFQSASWQEAIVGAEAGVDLAMNEFRKRVITGPAVAFQTNWTTTDPLTGTTYTDYGRAFPGNNQPYPITTHSGEGNTTTQLRLFVDVPGCDSNTNFAQVNDTAFISQIDNPNLRDPDGIDRSRWLFRVKSLGITTLTGPTRPNLNKYDNILRRFSFFNDWRTGRAVSSPQTARLVESIVRPQTGFRNALMADKSIDLSNQDVLINSYDSSKGAYSAINQGNQGNIATNGQLINANNAVVEGNALTNNGTVNGARNVTGQQSSNFYQELPPMTTAALNPSWNAVPNAGTITTTTTYTASNDPNNPTLVRLNGINLPDGGQVLNLVSSAAAKSANTPGYIKVYVQGDIATVGSSYINLDTNVNAIFYVTGNVSFQGVGILNNSFLASHLLFNGIQPSANSDGSFPSRSFNVATSEDFEGIVYAPGYDLQLALQAVSTGLNPGTMLSPNQGQVDDILSQIDRATLAISILQTDYAAQLARYQKNGDQGAFKKMQDDLNGIASDQTLITSLQQTLASLDNLLNPTSSIDDHLRGYNGIYGGFVAKTIKVASKTHVHYDETLRNAGPVNHFEIVNWFEDNLSHDSAGGAESFWWAN